MQHRQSICRLLLLALMPLSAFADSERIEFNGHAKFRLLGQRFPAGSLFRELTGSTAVDSEADIRLNVSANYGLWTFDAQYQLLAFYGDRVEYSRQLPSAAGLVFDRLPGDERRLFGLTDTLTDDGKFASLQRLDRLRVGYTTESTVLRIGRMGITWGNGLFFSPLDIVNPFDPTIVDAEYKTGDDMFYFQYLLDNGHDIEAAYVMRRNSMNGSVASDESTAAVKYNGLAGENEFQFLIAKSYATTTLGIGGSRSIGGAVLRSDLVLSNADDWTPQFVSNLSYSWTWREKNMSGAVEYFFSGFGLRKGRYDAVSIAADAELVARLTRGDTFTIGRNYLAAGLTIELSPLWLLTPNLFANLDDGSALLQFVTQYNLGDNLTFLGALNIPVGPDGTEYGGIDAGLPDTHFSSEAGLFAQVAWYF